MKKVILAVFALICINFNLQAQDIEQDITYYKLLNKLWTMSSSFDKVAFHLENQSVELKQTRAEELEVLAKLHQEVKADFELLKAKNYDNVSYRKVGEMMAAMERSLVDLKSEQWTSEPMWQYGYNVVKLRLGEMETQKVDYPQLSKNEK